MKELKNDPAGSPSLSSREISDSPETTHEQTVLLQNLEVTLPSRLPANYDLRSYYYILVLQACVRLKIPSTQYPAVSGLDPIPLPPDPLWAEVAPIKLPRVDLFRPEEWKHRAALKCLQHLEAIDSFHQALGATMFAPLKRKSGPKRSIVPPELACEWAVRHHRLGESWSHIQRSQAGETRYSLRQIQSNGYKVLRFLGIAQAANAQ
jgi:hypothetical protein